MGLVQPQSRSDKSLQIELLQASCPETFPASSRWQRPDTSEEGGKFNLHDTCSAPDPRILYG